MFSCHCKCHLSFKIFTCHNVRHYRSCAKACLHTLKKDTIVILKSYRKIRSIFFVELNFLELFAIACSCESPMSAGSVGSINNSNINVKYDYSIFDFIKYQSYEMLISVELTIITLLIFVSEILYILISITCN